MNELKRRIAAAASAALLLALCACAPAPAEPTPTPTPEPAPVLAAEPPIPDWLRDEPVPEFLDAEQQALFVHARAAASFLMGCETSNVDTFPLPDGSLPDMNNYETVELDGRIYLVSCGRYSRWDDFRAMMDGLFTEAYREELLNEKFMDGTVCPKFTSTQDGRMCYLELSRGSSLEYGWCDTPDSFELVSADGDEIVFNLVGHYAVLEAGEDGMPNPMDETTQAYPIRLELTDAGWRVAEFHVAY